MCLRLHHPIHKLKHHIFLINTNFQSTKIPYTPSDISSSFFHVNVNGVTYEPTKFTLFQPVIV